MVTSIKERMISDNNKIGIGLVITGMTLYFMGLFFLFDRTLLLLGNLCFLGGLVSILNIFGTISFFMKSGRMVGSVIFFVGILYLILLF